jgi:hypothetical protein
VQGTRRAIVNADQFNVRQTVIEPPLAIRNEALWRKQCSQVRALAGRIASGDVDIFEGSTRMVRLMYLLRADTDPDFNAFVALNSISDHLPFGKVRSKWNRQALVAKDQEAAAINARYHNTIIAAAIRVQEKYMPNQSKDPTP